MRQRKTGRRSVSRSDPPQPQKSKKTGKAALLLMEAREAVDKKPGFKIPALAPDKYSKLRPKPYNYAEKAFESPVPRNSPPLPSKVTPGPGQLVVYKSTRFRPNSRPSESYSKPSNNYPRSFSRRRFYEDYSPVLAYSGVHLALAPFKLIWALIKWLRAS